MNIDDVFKDEGSKEERVDEFQGQGATEEDTDTADDAAREGEEVSQDEEEQEAATPAAEDDSTAWTKSAVLAERKKRQNLEKEIEQLKAEKGDIDSGEEEPDLIEDPDGFKNSVEKKMSDKLLNMSVALMRESHDDFDEMADHFVELAKEDASLGNKMRASANPAKFAYDHAKKHLEFERVTAPDYIDSLKKQIREEVLQEMEADKKRKPAHNLVKSAPKGSNDTQPRAAVLDEIFADSHF